VRRRILAVALSAALVAGCGGAAKEQPPRTPPDPGFTGTGTTGSARPVDIGGRTLFVECHGSGSPTVLLEAGFGGSSKSWVTVMPALSRITRTCAYDRAGLGSSVAMPGVHDASDEVDDLGRLLAQASIPPPYVLVGHSYGGLLVRMFARTHQRDTAGLVLVDSMGADQTRRELAVWPRSEAPDARRLRAQRVVDGVDLRESEDLAGGIRTLGRIPLVVITAGQEDSQTAALPAHLRHVLRRLWIRMQAELAALSSDHVHVVALRSGHVVQSPDGQPKVVVEGVRAVVRAVRDRSRLPSCPQVFGGSGVLCAG
jgi:pimeloyl-ACP methyl ester carboxylesterase